MKRALFGGWLAILLALVPAGAAHGLGENYVAPPFRQYYSTSDIEAVRSDKPASSVMVHLSSATHPSR